MARAPRGSDLLAVFRGLGRVGSAALEIRSQEASKAWATSSFRPTIIEGGAKLQEAVTTAIQQPHLIQQETSRVASEAAARISMVSEGLKQYRGSSIQNNASTATQTDQDVSTEYDPLFDPSIQELSVEELMMHEALSNHRDTLHAQSPLSGVQVLADNIQEGARETKDEMTRRLSKFEPLLDIRKTEEREITDEHLEAIDSKLSELESVAFGHQIDIAKEVENLQTQDEVASITDKQLGNDTIPSQKTGSLESESTELYASVETESQIVPEMSVESLMMQEAMSEHENQQRMENISPSSSMTDKTIANIFSGVQEATDHVSGGLSETKDTITRKLEEFEPLLDVTNIEEREITDEHMQALNDKVSELQDVAFGHNLKIFKEIEHSKPVEEVLNDRKEQPSVLEECLQIPTSTFSTTMQSMPPMVQTNVEMASSSMVTERQSLSLMEEHFEEKVISRGGLASVTSHETTDAHAELDISLSQVAKPISAEELDVSSIKVEIKIPAETKIEPVEIETVISNTTDITENVTESTNVHVPEIVTKMVGTVETLPHPSVSPSEVEATIEATSTKVAQNNVDSVVESTPLSSVSQVYESGTTVSSTVTVDSTTDSTTGTSESVEISTPLPSTSQTEELHVTQHTTTSSTSPTSAASVVETSIIESTPHLSTSQVEEPDTTPLSTLSSAASVDSTTTSESVVTSTPISSTLENEVEIKPTTTTPSTVNNDSLKTSAAPTVEASTAATTEEEKNADNTQTFEASNIVTVATAAAAVASVNSTVASTSPEVKVTKNSKISAAPSKPKPRLLGRKPLAKDRPKSMLSENAQARKVPHSRFGRLMSFGGLAAGLGVGTAAEVTRRTLGLNQGKGAGSLLDSSPFLTEANAKRIVDTLCRVRGAALKLGQMLSIQDSALMNPQLQKIFERVRQSADFMPTWQLEKAVVNQLGEDWQTKVATFDERPFAAASIGQVHLATLHDGRSVAMKIQYPGVAEGIESDINNLISTLKLANILPEALFVDSIIEVAKKELRWECDYVREAECTHRFRQLVQPYPQYYVPEVIPHLCSQQIFTTELIDGSPVDKCVDMDQNSRNYLCEQILRLCLMELFQFGFMQTDPNWSNFFYNAETEQVALLDFGACREYRKEFVDKYIYLIHGASTRDRQKVLKYSQELGFLTGYEAKVMEDAHIDAIMILGEAFQEDKPFSFGDQDTTHRIQHLVPVMLSHRMCAPPEESYSLHRKMSGVFLLCTKLKGSVNCHKLFQEMYGNYIDGGTWKELQDSLVK